MSSVEATGQFTCGSCKKTIRYPASKAGLTGECPGCGNKITVPAITKVEEPKQQLVVSPPPAPAVKPAPVVQTQIIQQTQTRVELPTMPKPTSELTRFMSDGQNPSMIAKLLEYRRGQNCVLQTRGKRRYGGRCL